MSVLGPRAVTLRDGETVTVRPATADDIPALRALALEIQATTDYVLTGAGEMASAEEMRRTLVPKLARPGAVYLLAFAGDRPAPGVEPGGAVADCVCIPHPKRKTAHVAGMGIGAVPAYRGRGLGRAMLEIVIAHARAVPALRLLELQVMDVNERAIELYRSAGFVERGRIPGYFHQADGSFTSDVRMTLDVSA